MALLASLMLSLEMLAKSGFDDLSMAFAIVFGMAVLLFLVMGFERMIPSPLWEKENAASKRVLVITISRLQ